MNENLQWMSDERITNIPKVKLDFLQKIFFESKKLIETDK